MLVGIVVAKIDFESEVEIFVLEILEQREIIPEHNQLLFFTKCLSVGKKTN